MPFLRDRWWWSETALVARDPAMGADPFSLEQSGRFSRPGRSPPLASLSRRVQRKALIVLKKGRTT